MPPPQRLDGVSGRAPLVWATPLGARGQPACMHAPQRTRLHSSGRAGQIRMHACLIAGPSRSPPASGSSSGRHYPTRMHACIANRPSCQASTGRRMHAIRCPNGSSPAGASEMASQPSRLSGFGQVGVHCSRHMFWAITLVQAPQEHSGTCWLCQARAQGHRPTRPAYGLARSLGYEGAGHTTL